MLNWTKVLKYIKNNLALPSTYLEKTDAEIQEYNIDVSLKEFSTYFPSIGRCLIISDNTNYKCDGYSNRYFIYDDEQRDIISLKEVYFKFSNDVWTGHPYFGPTNMFNAKWWALSVFESKIMSSFTSFSKTYKFYEPNMIEILPNNSINSNDNFVVEYECTQSEDLSEIPTTLHKLFMDLCLSNTMMWIGSIRVGYTNLQTPFGQIELNADALLSRGETLHDRVLQTLSEESIPQVIIDIY